MRDQPTDPINRLCGELPDGWTASIEIYGNCGGASFELCDPDGNEVDFGGDNCQSVEEYACAMIETAQNAAHTKPANGGGE